MLNTLLEFVRDWVPSLAVVVAGAWVLFNWVVREQRRKRRETPSLEGEVHVSSTRLDQDRSFVSVVASWTNPGPYPVRVDTQKTVIQVFPIPSDLRSGPIEPKGGLGDPLYSLKLFAHLSGFRFEPGTTSHRSAHFVLDRRRCHLLRHVLMREDRETKWTRETVWDPRADGLA